MMQRMISSIKTLFRIDSIVFPSNEVKKNDEEIDVSYMYTTLSEAKEEIWRRWNDKELRKKVEKYLGEIPEPFRDGPRAVLSRHVITNNREFSFFYEHSKLLDLSPLGWEFLNDKFYSFNESKLSLGRLHFFSQNKKDKIKILDFSENRVQGKNICDLKTIWGEDLCDFHHSLVTYNFPEMEFYDATLWYEKIKTKNLIDKYKHIFALFICNGVMLEDFLLSEKEKDITQKVILPAFDYVCKEFGVKPLIVPLLPDEKEDEIFWFSYPREILELIPDYKK